MAVMKRKKRNRATKAIDPRTVVRNNAIYGKFAALGRAMNTLATKARANASKSGSIIAAGLI